MATWSIGGGQWGPSVAGDPSIPASSPLYFDATGTPGDVIVGSGVRKILVRPVLTQFELLITHPLITTSSQATISYTGNASASPEATRRESARTVAGQIVAGGSGGWIAADGDLLVTIEVL